MAVPNGNNSVKEAIRRRVQRVLLRRLNDW